MPFLIRQGWRAFMYTTSLALAQRHASNRGSQLQALWVYSGVGNPTSSDTNLGVKCRTSRESVFARTRAPQLTPPAYQRGRSSADHAGACIRPSKGRYMCAHIHTAHARPNTSACEVKVRLTSASSSPPRMERSPAKEVSKRPHPWKMRKWRSVANMAENRRGIET